MFRCQTIVCPTDLSLAAEPALQIARSLARDTGAKLILTAFVLSPPYTVDAYLPLADAAVLATEMKRELSLLAERVNDVPVELIVEIGDPGAGIVHVAGETHADLIVMGTHGRTGVVRMLMGSVAEYVVRNAPCPVLTIRAGIALEPTSVMAVAAESHA
ncbi:MAG: universal stress protein [Planctomycetaceae bacterium]|nr:universal stress protein [Planctomycetaceae bacterium]